MAWTNPRTFVAGEYVTAGDLNTHVRDNLAFLKERVQAGTVAITPVANTPTTVVVTFPVRSVWRRRWLPAQPRRTSARRSSGRGAQRNHDTSHASR